MTAPTLRSGIELSALSPGIRPQDDLFRHVNGAWLERTEIPDDKARWGSFHLIAEQAEKDVRAIIEESTTAEPGTEARLTAGHRTADARHGEASPDNLQTECARCNEPVGDTPPNPENLAEVMAAVKQLGAADKAALVAWLESGYRQRSKVDFAFDRARKLAASEKEQVIEFLRSATKGMGAQN